MTAKGIFYRALLVLFLLLPVNGAMAADSWVDQKTGLEFVKIAGGCYAMGQGESEGEVLTRLKMPFSVELSFGDELPRQEVCVDGFHLGRHEVTVAAFRIFVAETGYVTEAEKQGGCQDYRNTGYQWKKNDRLNWRNPGFTQMENEPVVCVSWNDSEAFAAWMSRSGDGRRVRLATEAEWEFAAREGGQGGKYAATGNDLAAVAWFVGNSPRRTSKVGSRRAGELGIYDLSGNVWEWVADLYAPDYHHGGGKNPEGPDQGRFRVIRGGGWNSFPWNCRVANRDRALPTHRDTNQGFRVGFSN